jgi:hypothetical protein
MADTPIPKPRETFFVTNVANFDIKITDIPSIPVIKPGQRIDLLVYARRTIVSSSTVVTRSITNGFLLAEEFVHTHDDKSDTGHTHKLNEITDVTASTEELTQLTNGSDADDLHIHGNSLDSDHLTDFDHDNISNNTDKRHDEAHTIVSHSDTSATGTELNTLTNGNNADALHVHNLTTNVDHNSITNTHNLTTNINHNSITNAHNLTTNINHNSITNAHNLTTDIDHNSLYNFIANKHIDWTNATQNLLTTGDISINSNSSRLYFGENQESSIYFDGINLNITLDEPSSGGVINLQDDVHLISDLVFAKESGNGIKIDTSDPSYGWADMIGNITYRGVGPTDPSLSVYITNIRQYQFAVNDETWIEFHIPHDYVEGTDIYIHAHWSHIAGGVTGGSVTWGFNIAYAKGHDQAAFNSTTVDTTVVGNANTTPYQHIITEIKISGVSPAASEIDTNDIEVDGLVLVRAYLSSNDMTGATPDPFLHFVDIHYQSTGIGTKQKAPDFYI